MDVLTVKQLPVVSERNPNGVDAGEVVEGVFNDLGQSRISYGHWKHSLFRYPLLWVQCQWWVPRSNRVQPVSPIQNMINTLKQN